MAERTNELTTVGSQEYRMYDIVDGQQRLTTLILLLKEVQINLPDGEEKDNLNKILVKSDGHLILLQSNNSNKHIFNDFIRGAIRPKRSDLETHADRNIYSGINDCRNFVDQWFDQNGDVLSLFRIIRNKLGFVVHDTDDAGAVYSVFEVLNSRGLAVDWLDKCKSSLMGIAYEKGKSVDAKESHINELNDLWGKIYEELATHPIPGHEVIRVTATLHMGAESSKPQKAETALTSLTMCSSPEDAITNSKRIYDVARMLVSLQSDVHLGPVTNVLQARILAIAIKLSTKLDNKEKQQALRLWEIVTFRIYGVFGKDSRSKVGDYIRLSVKIMDNLKYSEVTSELRKIGGEYPVESAIDEGLKNKNVYDGNQDVIRYLLWRYEEHLAKKMGNAIVNEQFKREIWASRSANETIEHIYPRNPEKGGAWDGKIEQDANYETTLNSIGNLILLPQKLNSEAGRSSFNIKKEEYKKSEGLRMVQKIILQESWSQKEIKDREEAILKWVREEWKDSTD